MPCEHVETKLHGYDRYGQRRLKCVACYQNYMAWNLT